MFTVLEKESNFTKIEETFSVEPKMYLLFKVAPNTEKYFSKIVIRRKQTNCQDLIFTDHPQHSNELKGGCVIDCHYIPCILCVVASSNYVTERKE